MLKILLAAVAGMILGMTVMGLSLNSKPPPIATAMAAECPPGLAEQAATKDAEYKKSKAEFEALTKGSK